MQESNYVIWILGILSFAVGSLAAIMFRWRREIDKEIADNRVSIAKLEGMQKEIDRNTKDIDRIAERYRVMCERDEDDWDLKR